MNSMNSWKCPDQTLQLPCHTNNLTGAKHRAGHQHRQKLFHYFRNHELLQVKRCPRDEIQRRLRRPGLSIEPHDRAGRHAGRAFKERSLYEEVAVKF